jgi:hypothetical protein
VKAKSQNRTCPDGLSNECVVWQGGDVPVIGIYNGDPLSIAEFAIATKILELFDNIDMSKIDMHCLQETAAQKCKDNSLKAVVQALYDNQCSLVDLINNINAQPPTVDINVNMRCLTKFDDFGNTLPQDLNQSIQSIVNQVCVNVTSITSLQAEIQTLQKQVDAIPTEPTVPPEPTITTCLTPALRPVSQTVPLVAQAFCDFQTAFGTASDASIAISQQCQNLNTTFAGVQGWLNSVNNLAQSMNNLWLLSCNLNTRMITIEENCCKLTCKDIAIGFNVQVDQNGTGVFLKFTAGAGTDIPSGFTDAGSSVTFTDKNNQFVTYPLVISNNATQGDFDLSGLDLTDPITISVTAIMATDGLTCEKCITKLYTIGNNTCPVCQVTATGTTGHVTIAYTTPPSTTVNTLVLQPSQSGYLPTNAIIVAITSTGDTTAGSTCMDLTPPPLVCYIFSWEHAGNYNAEMMTSAYFTELSAGNLTYTLTPVLTPNRGNPGPDYYPVAFGISCHDGPNHDICGPAGTALLASINATNPGIIIGTCVITETPEDSVISVQLPKTLGVPELKIALPDGSGKFDYLYIKGILSTNGSDCSCNGSGSGGVLA